MRLVVQVQAIGNQFLQLDFREPVKGSAAAGPAFMAPFWSASTLTTATGTTIVATRTTLAAATILPRSPRRPIAARFAAMAMLRDQCLLLLRVALGGFSFGFGFSRLQRLGQGWC